MQRQIMAWPWNWDSGSFKVIENGTVRKLGYGFLFVFYNCDIARYWSKIAIFSYAPCIRRPIRGVSVGILPECLVLQKLEWRAYPRVKKVWWNVEPFPQNTGGWRTQKQTDGRVDGQTDIMRKHSPRYAWHRAVKTLGRVHASSS